MPSVLDPVAAVEERHSREMHATRELSDWRVVPTALLFSGLAAAGAWLALSSPVVWLVVAAILVAWWKVRGFFVSRSDRAAAGLMALLEPVTPPTGVVADLPPSWLLPTEVTSLDQLERLLRPTPGDLAVQFREIPGTSIAAWVTSLLWGIGFALVTFGPLLYLLATDHPLGESDLTLLVAVAAGLPLASLTVFSDRAIALAREQMAWLVDVANGELLRLWHIDPNFTEGRVVVREGDGYRIDVSQMLVPPTARRSQLILRKANLIGLAVVVPLAVVVIVLQSLMA